MQYIKKCIVGLVLSIPPLAYADDSLYYMNSGAIWDSSQFLIGAVMQSSIKPEPIQLKIDFETWNASTTWLNGSLKLGQGTVKLAFGSQPLSSSGTAPELVNVPWTAGNANNIEYRDEIFGRTFLKQSPSPEGERYLTIYSDQPLIGLAAVTYNRTSNTCNDVLSAKLYSGHDLATAKLMENKIKPSPIPANPECLGQSGKVDVVMAIANKPRGSKVSETFNYAVIDLGSKQKQMSLDNLVFYFAPQP
ncbi:hypothetical protein ACUHMQ_03875 [Chitinimonas sp. PSY-7]|uniref:hypothetical protein n=1 Tax=Chitinimonas sp. PSY-7 TaxID=3459088 RepID=UPI00403FDC3F